MGSERQNDRIFISLSELILLSLFLICILCSYIDIGTLKSKGDTWTVYFDQTW